MQHKAILTTFLLLNAAIFAQTRPSSDQILDNMARATGTLLLDRAQYLPGEEMNATFRWTNPTDQPLQLPKPLHSAAFRFRVQNIDDQGNVIDKPSTALSIATDVDPLDSVPLLIVAPVGSVEQMLSTSADGFPDSTNPPSPAPSEPGRYQLDSEQATRRFTVVSPILEAVAKVSLGRTEEGFTGPFAAHRYVVALRFQETTYICISTFEVGPLDLTPDRLQRIPARYAALTASTFSPIRRIHTSTRPIVTLSLTIDSLDNATIIWTDNAGTQGRIDLDANLNPR